MSVQISSSVLEEMRRNLALNPNAVGALGFSSTNSANWTVVRGTGLAGNPQGITTGALSVLADGVSVPELLSMSNIDALNNVAPARRVGAWFYCSQVGYQARIYGGADRVWVPLPSGVWTWVEGNVDANTYAIGQIARIIGNAVKSGTAAITGVTAVTEGSPTATIAGGIVYPSIAQPSNLSASWTGPVNASESILSGYPSTSPDLVLGWEQSRAGGAIAQDVIGGGVRIAVGMSRPRTGTLELFYKDEAAAVAAFDMHQHAASFVLSDLDTPGSWREMRYVVTADGGCRIRLDTVTRRRWIVEVDYQEMQPSL